MAVYRRTNLEIVPKEETEQAKFVAWLRKWLTVRGIKFTASANGGKRDLLTGVKLKRLGVSKGFPDIEIPFPSGQYHGCYIEMKRVKGGRLEQEQIEWLNYLRDKGYYAQVAKGCEEAKEMVLYYLSLTKPAA